MYMYVCVDVYRCEAVGRLYEETIESISQDWMILLVIKVEKTGKGKEKETNE